MKETAVLLVEDDEALAATISSALTAEGMSVRAVADGESGMEMACGREFEIVLLDLVLPGPGGLEICRKMRDSGITTPIIFLTGKKKEEIDTVLGLELGGDDYMIKPFGTRELLARIHAVLRRSEARPESGDMARFDDVVIDFRRHIVRKGDRELNLTATEVDLLRLLIDREGEVVTRDTILNRVWGYDRFPTTRTIDTFIHGLRRKLETDPSQPRHILTVPWRGYRFVR